MATRMLPRIQSLCSVGLRSAAAVWRRPIVGVNSKLSGSEFQLSTLRTACYHHIADTAVYGKSLVTYEAPDFTAEAVYPDNSVQNVTLSSFKGKKYVCLFFWPLDFTFVCPSEVLAFHHALSEFEKRNVQVLGASIDSTFSHLAWKRTAPADGGIGDVQFPMISDITKDIAHQYGILVNQSVALRGLFIIDMEGIVRHQLVNDLPLGRNVQDTLRLIDALQHTEKHGEVCPANWSKGDKAMAPTQAGVSSYLAETEG